MSESEFDTKKCPFSNGNLEAFYEFWTEVVGELREIRGELRKDRHELLDIVKGKNVVPMKIYLITVVAIIGAFTGSYAIMNMMTSVGLGH